MPVYEFTCPTVGCRNNDLREEHYLSRFSAPNPVCSACGVVAVRLMSTFNVPFVGTITSRYNDKKREYASAEGLWATRKKTPDGKPQQVFLETWQDRREFLKAEGLVAGEDVGPIDAPADGKFSIDDSGSWSRTGKPGTWAAPAQNPFAENTEPEPEDVSAFRFREAEPVAQSAGA